MTPASSCTISYRLARTLVVSASLLWPIAARAQQSPPIVVVASADSADPRAASIGRGLTLGTEEALHTAKLFGVALQFLPAEGLAMDSVALRSVGVWVIAGDESRCARVRAALRGAQPAVVDAGCRTTEPPLANEVRIHPTARDSAAALATAPGDSGRVLLWHSSLERFGADQLNDRFRRRFSANMDSDAWAAWAAVKIAAEACLRARPRRVAPLAVLLDSSAAFDAHKGMPLRFDPATRRLAQPLYVVGGGRDPFAIREIAPSTPEP